MGELIHLNPNCDRVAKSLKTLLKLEVFSSKKPTKAAKGEGRI
jgi:hypothetical protein